LHWLKVAQYKMGNFDKAKEWARKTKENTEEPSSTLVLASYFMITITFIWTLLSLGSSSNPEDPSIQQPNSDQQEQTIPAIPVTQQPMILPHVYQQPLIPQPLMSQQPVQQLTSGVRYLDANGRELHPNEIPNGAQLVELQAIQ